MSKHLFIFVISVQNDSVGIRTEHGKEIRGTKQSYFRLYRQDYRVLSKVGNHVFVCLIVNKISLELQDETYLYLSGFFLISCHQSGSSTSNPNFH